MPRTARPAPVRSSLPDVTLADGGWPAALSSGADVVAVPVRSSDVGPIAGSGADQVATAFGLEIADELRHVDAAGKVGETTAVPVAAEGSAVTTVRLLGVGDGSVRCWRRAGAALARAVRGATTVALGVDGDDASVQAAVEGFLLASYRFTRKSGAAGDPAPAALVVVAPGRRSPAAVARALTVGRAVHRARDLANTPSNEKDPAWLAARAVEFAEEAGLGVRIRDEQELAAEGFGGIVAVGSGSARPPRLIELTYEPASTRRVPHVVLVGKGITFDSGGLSLKPREAMVPMKTDMAAGGAVLAVMAALRDLDVKVRVTGLVAAAENLPGAAAMRPGDVITHYGGRTVEVLNTDAEGRLVLADALAYADAVLAPDVVIDLATLTGAASLGLGKRHAALYTADERLATSLAEAADASGERVWRMPLVEDYRPAMESRVADLANVATDKKVSGGSITAALFLREFAGRRRWVHLDIAGPARADSDEHEVTRGGTGFGARLLLRWLEQAGTRV